MANKKSTPSNLRRNKPALLRLEPRVMFDGAGAVDLITVLAVEDMEHYIAPPAVDETEVAEAEPLAVDFAEINEQAKAEILAYLSGDDAMEKLFAILHGNQGEPSAEWLEQAEELLSLLQNSDYEVNIRFLSEEQMPGLFAAFAAEGPDGEPTIFINLDWWNKAEPEKRIQVLIEEYGHSFDHFLNPGNDTIGDEGEAFAAAVLDIELNFLDQARIAIQNDHATIIVDGEEFVVETANFSFVNAYEMVYDLNNNGQIDNTERWAEKEQNTHYFNTDPLGQVGVLDDVDSRYFSGNDVSAIGINIAGTDYYGWISRPIKANGVVRGFYFWTDDDFVDLAIAQADGNQDGDRDVSDNRGFVLVLDQAWFDAQITKTEKPITINNAKDGNLGAIQYAAVGSSSDRVDSALNALIVDNSAPVANPDLLSGDAGTMITGNVLDNDTDADNDALTVTQFVVDGQTYNAGETATLNGIGSLTIGSDGEVTFVPVSGYSGNVPTVTYTVSDGEDTASTVLSIIVNEVNDPPISTNDTITVDTGAPTLLGLGDFGQYNDPNNDPLALIKITSLPAAGTLEYYNGTTWVTVTENQEISAADINAGRLRYTTEVVENVNIGFAVSDDKDYSISDYTLAITVNEGAPVANDINADPAVEAGLNNDGNAIGSSSTGSILPDGSSLSLTFIGNTPVAENGDTVVQGMYGTLTVTANGSYTYTPNNAHPDVDALNVGGSLTENFRYTVANSAGITASAALNVSINGTNDAPVANSDAAVLKELNARHGDGHYGTVAGNVLTNDTDVDNDDNTLKVVIGDSDTIDGDGVSVEVFATSPITATTYNVTDAGGNNWTSVISNSVYASFSYYDADNNLQVAKQLDGVTDLQIIRTGSGQNATLLFNESAALYQYPEGTIFSYTAGNTALFTVGITSVTVTSSTDITVTSGDLGSVAVDYIVTGSGIPEGTTVTAINGATVTLSNAVQIVNTQLTFTDPNSGSAPVAGEGEMLLTGTYGYLRIAEDGSYTYTLTDNSLNAGDTITETFNYKATDGTSESTETTLTITVDGTTAAPDFIVVDDTFTTNEDEPLSTNLLTNDTATTVTGFTWGDQPGTVGTPLFIEGIGTLTIQSNGDLTFTPAQDYNGPIPVITYTASSGSAELASATATITITPVNDAPTSTDDAITVAVNTPTLLTLSDFGDYSDIDGDPLSSITITSLPADGALQKLVGGEWVAVAENDVFTVADIADGKLRYTTATNAAEAVNYTTVGFKVNDGTVDSDNNYTLTVHVIEPAVPFGEPPVNTVPVAQTTTNYEPLTITGLSVDDPNDDITTVTLSVAKGTLNVTDPGALATGNGSSIVVLTGTKAEINTMLATLTYTANSGSAGEDTLRIYTVDNTDRSATDFVAINVTPDTRVLTVTGTTVNEASPYLMFQVTGEAGQMVSLELAETGSGDGHATIGQDVLPIFEYFDGTNWQSYTNGSLVAIPAGATTLLVRVAVLQDNINEGAETLKLIGRNTNNVAFEGNGTIIDDGTGMLFTDTTTPDLSNGNTLVEVGLSYLDDDRPITVNNIAVNEASPYAVFTVTGANGQVVQLALEAGTADLASATPATDGSEDFGQGLEVWDGTAWVSYTAGDSYTMTGSTLLVRTLIINDDVFEGQEGFALAVTKLSAGTTVYGIASIYDDGTGDVYLGNNNTGTPNTSVDPGYPAELDDDRSLAFAAPDVHVNENSNFVIFTLTGDSGQTVTLELLNTSENGTVEGKANIPDIHDGENVIKIYMGVDHQGEPIWEAYDPNKALPTFNEAGKLFVAVDIRAEQDDIYEGPETFQLKATLAHQAFDEDKTPDQDGWITNIESTRPEHTVTATATIHDDGTALIFTGKIGGGDEPETTTDNLDDDRPDEVTITSPTVNEASPYAVFTITGTEGQVITLELADSTATGGGVDYGPGLEVSLDGGVIWTTYDTSVTMPEGGSFLARTPIIDDNIAEGDETFTLTATPNAGDPVVGTATINDQGAGTIFNPDGTENTDAPKDSDTPGLTLDKTTLTTSENLTTDSFTVVLDSEPTHDVTFEITGLDASEGSLNTTTLTFTPDNWDTPQTVTVTGVDDDEVDGNQNYTLTLTASSTDANYNDRTATATVTNLDNDVSIGGDTTGTGSEDTTLSGTLTATNQSGLDPTTPYTVSSNPSNGTATINASGQWIYTPNTDWNGSDSFVVTVTDALGNTTTQAIAVTVEPVQDAFDDTATTTSGQSVVIDVLANDEFDSSPVTLTAVTQPANGSATVNPDGTITYTPNPDFSGTDTFTYTANTPGGTPETATVTVTITAPASAPPPEPVVTVVPDPIVPPAPTIESTPPMATTDEAFNEPAPWDTFTQDESVGGEHELRIERDIPLQSAKPGEGLSFTIPTDTFVHTDQQATLMLMATMLDGSPLPEWLVFDPTTGEISGTPPADFQGEVQIRVVARDQIGRQAETMVSIQAAGTASAGDTNKGPVLISTSGGSETIANQGRADITTTISGFVVRVDPTGARDGQHDLKVDKAIPDLEFTEENREFSYQIPIDAFVHSDAGAEIELSAMMLDGSELPEWLVFDAKKGELKGEIPDDFEGEIIIRVIARDQDGRQAETILRIIRQILQPQALLEGRPELDSQLAEHGILAWKSEQEALVRQALEVAEQLALAKAS